MHSDVCLVLEGTYPYIAGGVSTWVAQLLENLPQLRFSLFFIGAKRALVGEAKYELPPNVVELREFYLHDFADEPFRERRGCPLDASDWETVRRFQQDSAAGRVLDVAAACRAMEKLPERELLTWALAQSPQAWQAAVELYEAAAPPDSSFVDYFWTHRFITLPVLSLLAAPLPRARVYHTACTGYAGLVAAKAARCQQAAAIITEHGIYTRERRIEIFKSEWIKDNTTRAFLDLSRAPSFFKEWWIRFFLALSRTAYASAACVTTLFEANRQAQIRDGAAPERTAIVPNGIDTAAFAGLTPRRRHPGEPLRIGFVGRVSAIKDVKTLLRTLAVLRSRKVPFECRILGPLDEEEDYVEECRELLSALELGESTRFWGPVKVKEHYPELDVVVLTSISEGLPFVILEANCAGGGHRRGRLPRPFAGTHGRGPGPGAQRPHHPRGHARGHGRGPGAADRHRTGRAHGRSRPRTGQALLRPAPGDEPVPGTVRALSVGRRRHDGATVWGWKSRI